VDAVAAQEERDLQECTFKPAVKAPSKDMHVAREYLSVGRVPSFIIVITGYSE
jgi:hypothetical protein